MIKRFVFSITALAAVAAAMPAAATVFYGTYAPSDTPMTPREAPQNFLPLRHRLPDQSFSGTAGVSGYCANIFCSYFIGQSVTTDFTPTTSFTATKLIVPALLQSPYGNRRVGFSVSEWNPANSQWVGLSYAQIESGLVPQNTIVEIEVPFGLAGGGFVDFNYQPISFQAGRLYRLSASAWAGALGSFVWYASNQAAAPGQSIQYEAVQASSGGTPTNMALQPAFAFSDGGDLQPAPPVVTVPEPASWALMIIGFGAVGGSLRHRRRPATLEGRAAA